MTVDVDTDYNLDAVFTEVGEFGLFHIISYFLLCLPNIIQATHVTSYVFTSTTLEHRLVNFFLEKMRRVPSDQSLLIRYEVENYPKSF